MYKMYLDKILYALQRGLSSSELKSVQMWFDNGVSVKYAIEYLK